MKHTNNKSDALSHSRGAYGQVVGPRRSGAVGSRVPAGPQRIRWTVPYAFKPVLIPAPSLSYTPYRCLCCIRI